MNDPLASLVARHRGGTPIGITSVCSANPLVLEATMREAALGSGPVLVEATSNQVNQEGGYTGMRPADFRTHVLAVARAAGVDENRVLLGGDHLGPNPWRDRPAEEAMALADELVGEYAAAGFTKIHLDCSMACGGDPTPPGDALVSQRAARLAAVAEAAAGPHEISYVIGTEVPVPGGAAEAIHGLVPTSAAAARATLRAHREAFERAGLGQAWPRVRGLVVQPGVEFDEWAVVDYDDSRTGELQAVLAEEPGLVFEAHSTDYQTTERLSALVRDHWAILKVGPGLTFALREALFALESIERELVAEGERSRLRAVVEERMLAHPGYWDRYYGGDEATRARARVYSFSDRLRYYWPDPKIEAAVERLLTNLAAVEIPPSLLSAWLPAEYARVRAEVLAPEPRALALDHVRAVLRAYHRAGEPAD